MEEKERWARSRKGAARISARIWSLDLDEARRHGRIGDPGRIRLPIFAQLRAMWGGDSCEVLGRPPPNFGRCCPTPLLPTAPGFLHRVGPQSVPARHPTTKFTSRRSICREPLFAPFGSTRGLTRLATSSVSLTWAWTPLDDIYTGGAPLSGYRLYMNTGREDTTRLIYDGSGSLCGSAQQGGGVSEASSSRGKRRG